jgi:hypothetical protein
MSKRIILRVSPKGVAEIKTSGFTGAECQEATAAVERALGKRVSEELTDEYHAAAPLLAQEE